MASRKQNCGKLYLRNMSSFFPSYSMELNTSDKRKRKKIKSNLIMMKLF